MSTKLTAGQLRVLTALRNASDIKRKPRKLAPDGRTHWWSLPELVEDGWISDEANLAKLRGAATTLYKHHFVGQVTLYTVLRYRITEVGRILLASLEERAGVTDVVAAQVALAQARYDLEAAKEAVERTREQARAAHAEIGNEDPEQLVWKVITTGIGATA